MRAASESAPMLMVACRLMTSGVNGVSSSTLSVDRSCNRPAAVDLNGQQCRRLASSQCKGLPAQRGPSRAHALMPCVALARRCLVHCSGEEDVSTVCGTRVKHVSRCSLCALSKLLTEVQARRKHRVCYVAMSCRKGL